MNYNYILLSVIGICTIVFLFRCFYKRDWISLVHPYVAFSFCFAFIWHNATQYPGMERYVDTVLAISYILFSAAFWLVHYCLREDIVKKFVFPCFKIRMLEIPVREVSPKVFWILFVFTAVFLAFMLFGRAGRVSPVNWFDFWFAANRYLSDKVQFPYRVGAWVRGGYCYLASVFMVLILVLPFIEKSRICLMKWKVLSLFLFLFWSAVWLGDGRRMVMLLVPSFLIIITFILLVSGIKIKKRNIIVLFFYMILSLTIVAGSGVVRQSKSVDVVSKQFINKPVNAKIETLLSGTPAEKAHIPQNPSTQVTPAPELAKQKQKKQWYPEIKCSEKDFDAFKKKYSCTNWSTLSNTLACCFLFYPSLHEYYGYEKCFRFVGCYFLPREFAGKDGKPVQTIVYAARDMRLYSNPDTRWC